MYNFPVLIKRQECIHIERMFSIFFLIRDRKLDKKIWRKQRMVGINKMFTSPVFASFMKGFFCITIFLHSLKR